MSKSQLPQRASLEYLKKLAKDRLRELRKSDLRTKLATAQLAVARDHGFSSWRALKAEVEWRHENNAAPFFEACAKGDGEMLRDMLRNDPALVRATIPDSPYHGWTALHEAAKRGHADAVRLLLEYGADPNAREAGDNTYPLHWAAAHGHADIVRALLDAGGDVHGIGDVHELDVIGWATVFREPGEDPTQMPVSRRELVSLLLERGARHHIFSAMAVGDLDLIRELVEEKPDALDRRMSRFEEGQTPLHFAMNRKRYDILDLLIGKGADLEAQDLSDHTALATAMLHGDWTAMTRLRAAGAKQPAGWSLTTKRAGSSSSRASMARLADSINKGVPMISVPDIARALDWYTSMGFKELGRYAHDGVVNWGEVSFGKAELMFMIGQPGKREVRLWFYTDQVDPLYRALRFRQLGAAQAALAAEPGDHEAVEFVEDLYDPPYGGRQFSIRDLNGYTLIFLQPG
jgi:ankyrin repeat protein/catechol 2,3-dioxygenase-like lactoylglutathione lyase family enzyme